MDKLYPFARATEVLNHNVPVRVQTFVTLHRGTAKKERKAIYIRQYAVIVYVAERAEP